MDEAPHAVPEYTIRQASAAWGVKYRTLLRACQAGKTEVQNTAGETIYFHCHKAPGDRGPEWRVSPTGDVSPDVLPAPFHMVQQGFALAAVDQMRALIAEANHEANAPIIAQLDDMRESLKQQERDFQREAVRWRAIRAWQARPWWWKATHPWREPTEDEIDAALQG